MPTRSYTAQFFQAECFAVPLPQRDDALYGLFVTEKAARDAGKDSTLALTPSGNYCELRDLNIFPEVVTGCVGLLRPDAPNIRDGKGAERLVPTNPGEHFLEKNYFIYYKTKRVIAWQFNLAANHINNFGLLLSAISGQTMTISCHTLLADDFAFNDNVEVKLVDVLVRAPKTNAERTDVAQLNPNNWGVNPFQIMAATGANNISLKFSTGREQGNLIGGAKTMVKELLGSTQTRRLKVKVAAAEEPIDLLARRVKRKIEINMNGFYVDPASAWQELQKAKDDADVEIQSCV